MKKYGNEFKVGLFVILCILGLAYLTYRTGKLNIKKEGYSINVVFDEIAGLQKKAPVMLNGMEVGKVEDIQPTYENDKTRILLRVWLSKEAKVRENPIVSIKTLGLMGEKYIQISSREGQNFIAPGTTIAGQPYMDMDTLMASAEEISTELKKLAKEINYSMGGNKDKVSTIVSNFEATSKNFEEFSADIKRHPWKLLYKTKEKPVK
jgi:phospholipid/cholesterol/gamma-HCH transport system substrate-binding protein